MATNKDFFKNRVIISPFEARHFILTLPKVKKSFYENAVKFELRTVYPGDESSTKYDYFSTKGFTIGIAANSEKINSLKSKSETILSPVLLIFNFKKNGISIFEYDDWCEILYIEEGNICSIRDFKTSNHTGIYSEIRKLYEEKSIKKITYYYIKKRNNELITELQNEILVENVNLLEYIHKTNLNKSEIFEIKKKNRKLPFILFILALFIFGTWRVNKNQKEIELLNQKKENLKTEFISLRNGKNKEDNRIHQTTRVNTNFSLFNVLCVLRSTSASIKIDNITINNNDIRIEASNSDALSVLDKLAEKNIFKNLVLVQSIPQIDGTERFIITGKIQND